MEEVAPTEDDVVHALMEMLVYPLLARFSINTNTTPSIDQHNAVATQMHAVVLLYNYYHMKQNPHLNFLDFSSFSNLVLRLKPSLAPFFKPNSLDFTQKSIQYACHIASSLDASLDLPNMRGWPISRVAVLLIDSTNQFCKLQFGAITQGVWSLFEKHFSAEKPGDKRRNTDIFTDILQICYDIVREITGTESNELVVLGSEVTYSLKEEKSATQFYLIRLPGTISIKEQVPLKDLVQRLEGPLAKIIFGTWSATDVVKFYHLLPYVGFISRWLSGKDLCSPSIDGGFAQSTIKSCSNEDIQSRIPVSIDTIKDSEHTDSDSFGKTTNKSSDETGKKCKRSSDREGSVAVHKIPSHIDRNANQRRDTTKKNSWIIIQLEKAVQDMNERENVKNSVKDDDIVLKKSTKPRLFPVSSVTEAVNGDQHKVFRSKVCSPMNVAFDTDDTQKIITVFAPKNVEGRSDSPNILLSEKEEIEDCQNEGSVFCQSSNSEGLQHNLSLPTQIGNNHDGTTWNAESVRNTGFRNGKVSGESEVAISSDQIQNAITDKPADYDQPCQIEGTTGVVALENELASSEELQNALSLLCTKRETLYSQICSMEDTLAQYEDCIERVRDGGEVGLARRCIESIISGNDHSMMKNETRIQDKDHKSKSQTGKQSSNSGILVPSKCQYLEYMSLKNNWRLPRYLVEPAEAGKFRSNVVVVGKDLKLASKSGRESSPIEARESAAAQMIAEICYDTEESMD